MDAFDIRGVAHERQGDHVHASPQRPAQVVFVLLAQSRNVDRDAGEVDALIIGHFSPGDDLGDNLTVINLDRTQRDLPVVDQQAVTDFNILGQALEGRGADVLGALDVINGDGETVTNFEHMRPVGEPTEPDFRALQISEHTDRSTEFL